jgi:hypothetical protein
MKKIISLSFSLFIIFCQNANTQEDELDKELEQLRDKYVSHLTEEGYRPEILEDGDIKFKKEGKTFYIEAYDQYVFAISRYLALEDDQKCTKSLLNVLNDFHFKRASERVRVYDECKTVEIQSFNHLNNPDDWEKVFERSTYWMDYAAEDFWELYYDSIE